MLNTILQGNLYTECVTIHGSKHTNSPLYSVLTSSDCEGGVTCKSDYNITDKKLYTALACTSYHSQCDVVFTVEMYPVHWITFTLPHRLIMT